MRTYVLALGILFQASLGFSQAMLYSFSGHVSSLFYDGGGILAAENVAVGDPVSVSFIVNFNAPGYYLLNNGRKDFPVEPPMGNLHMGYFYCRLASGTLLPEANGGLNHRPQDIREYFTGWNSSSPMGNEGLLQGGTGDSHFAVQRWSQSDDSAVENWQVGTEVRGVIVAFSNKDWSIAWADMTLDSITAVTETNTPPSQTNHFPPSATNVIPSQTSRHSLKPFHDYRPADLWNSRAFHHNSKQRWQDQIQAPTNTAPAVLPNRWMNRASQPKT